MRKFAVCLIISFVILSSNIYAKELNVVSDGAILMDYETGRVIWGKNIDKPLAMASTTKIMTAIIALENGNLRDIVTVSKNATKAPDVKMNIQENEEILLEDLLYALMLQSSNDCAIAIAEHIGGSVEKFCEMMTEKAKIIGATDTLFLTPNGLDEGEHHSTAYDMAIITRYALDNEELMKIVSTSNVTIKTNKRVYDVTNKNAFLTSYDGATGMKTGYTNKAGYCFVGSATREDMTLISVVLASGWGASGKEQKWTDSKTLLDYGFNNFKYVTALESNVLDETIEIIKGSKNQLDMYYEEDIVLLLLDDEIDKLEIVLEYENVLNAPIYVDEKVGTASIYLEDEFLGSTNILAYESITKNTVLTNMGNILKSWVSMINY